MKHITIIMGSDSDKNIADKTIEVLEKFNVPYNLEQASAHREPTKVREVVADSQADVFICIAGLAAALPGVVASLTAKPVVGVPKDVKLGGLDALLSIVQMPSGIPVGTVGIDNGKNAAYLAIRILGIKYPEVLTGESSESDVSSSVVSSTIPTVSGSETSSESNIRIPGAGGASASVSGESLNEGTFPGGMMDMFSQNTVETEKTKTEEKKPRGDWL